jgi:hypothetical protein
MGQQAQALYEYLHGERFHYTIDHIRHAIERGFITKRGTAGLSDEDLMRVVRKQYRDEYRNYFDVHGAGSATYSDIRVPRAGSWFIHFTHGRFTSFGTGVNRYYLGDSYQQRTDRFIECPANLTADPIKALWIHAFEVFPSGRSRVLHPRITHSGPGYGTNAVLFQASDVVVGKHYGHSNEEHALVLGCSEFNAVMLTDVGSVWNDRLGRDTIGGIAHLKSGPTEFDSLEDLTTLLSQTVRRGGLAGLYGSRWHPLARAG